MTKASRLLVVCLLLLGMMVLSSTFWAQTSPSISEQIAKTYGLDSFSQIEAIRYTFNAEGPLKVSRTWVWEPKADRVSYEGPDKAGKPAKLTYVRSQLSAEAKEIDPGFINDQYWLLFPFHLVWDKSAKVEDTGTHKLPMGKGSAKRIVVTYPSDGGYTPGDTWELFVGADNRIQEWVYHHGGSVKPSGTWTWVEYKKAGPLLVSENHLGTIFALPGAPKPLPAGKPLRIFFSDVSVKLTGSDAWVKAQ